MASGKLITNKTTLSGSISSGSNKSATITAGSGTTDHSRLINRSEPDQHPIEAITGLRSELDSKLNSKTAMPLIEDALQGKAKGLYFDAMKEFARKSYWYLTAEIDPKTGLGTKDSIISGPYDLGMGGGSGGGGGGVTSVSIKQVNWPAAASVGNADIPTTIKINWTSVIGEDKTPTGEGTLYLTVNGKQVETRPKQPQGEIEFDISQYIISGDNTIQVKVLDTYGTTGLTVGTITGISLELKSTFNQDTAYYGKIDFTYTPIGNVTKKVYFIIDGDEKNAAHTIVKSSNELQTYTIHGLSHGAHTLKVYFEADVGGQTISSNVLFYDITFVESGNSTPIIASEFSKFTQEQYISFNIPYRVFIDGRNAATVTFKVNEKVIRSSEVTTNGTHIWAYRYDDYTIDINGNKIEEPLVLEIVCGSVTKRFEVSIVESTITVTPILNNLELALTATGKSNDDLENRENWSYTTTPPPGSNEEPKTYNCTFTKFNWKSDGWVLDKTDTAGNPTTDSTTVLRVGGDARVDIPLNVFESNFTGHGKTIELEIATHGIRDYESPIIYCLDNDKTPFYTVEPLFEKEDERLDGYEVSYTYSILSETIKIPGKYLFKFNGTSWTQETVDENKQTITSVVNLEDYGITLTKCLLNAEGEDLGSVIAGDRILINFSMEARGFEITPQVASIRSQQSFLSTQYKEDEHVRISFVVEPSDADHNRIIWMYINGVASGAMQYPVGESFQQKSPSHILIGSSEAIVDVYNIRVYNAALTNRQVVNNWIADTADPSLKATRFNHNQVLNEQDQVTPASLNIGAPDLPYIIWDIDPLPQSKKDVRPGNAFYTDPSDSTRNFTALDAEYKVQGTSSAVYPTKNIRLRTKKGKGGPNLEWYDEDGNDLIIKNGGKGFPITQPNGIGVDYFTFKVDYASSEGANNVELTKLYNDASIKYGLLTPPQQQDSKVRVGIDGFPIVAFHQNNNDEITFCTKANFNNDKGNEDVYGFAGEWADEATKELWLGDESWETTNNSAAETKYQKPVTAENFAKGFEIRFPDEDGYNKMDKLGPMTAWVYSTYREAATGTALNPPVTLPWQTTVQAEDGTTSTKTEPVEFTHDTAEYRLAKFKAELKDWFNVDSCLFYYLFTELFLMIDSRAKNAFPTYFATRTKELVKDDEGKEIPNTYTDGGNRWYWIPYDMDTAIGIDNKGKLTFDYYLEDIDQLDGADVYNGQTSVMWCNIRDAFRGELAAMYLNLRNQGLITYAEVEKRFEEHQGKWPEVILNLDSHNKYIVPLKNGDNYLEMLQGTKAQQRKWWLYNRFKYMDSKYNAGDALADFVQFRAYVDIGQEKPNLEITPYANIYATASFGNGAEHLVSKRVLTRGESIILENTFRVEDDENDQETYIYSASQLKSIGDISPFHPDTVKIGNAIRLQDLKVGDDGTKYPGYTNPYLKELTVGANTLLRTLDARNCTNLGTGTTVAPDLSQCTNIEEIYFTGTKIKGITLPDGGTIKTLHLPGTLTALTIKNQPLLTDLKIENTNTTITRSAYNEDNYTVTGLVISKDLWNTTNANANVYLATDETDNAQQIRVSLADKDLYESLIPGESKLTVNCSYIDVRYDLINDTEVQLIEYSTRLITKAFSASAAATSNIDTVIGAATATIKAPEVSEFKISLIETLWLEGIPSEAIKAKEFIKNMKEGTEVRLININETYKSWEEIREFYNLLDRHYGINFNNSPIRPKAQVTGIINIAEISYTNYIELTTRYPEVTINAKKIISNITFYNDGQEYYRLNESLTTVLDSANKLSIIGKTVQLPEHLPNVPSKDSTQAYWYKFNCWKARQAIYSPATGWEYDTTETIWTAESLITANTRIDALYDATLQKYKVTFDTDSDFIYVDDDHKDLEVDYGSTITIPNLQEVPNTVQLAEWYNTDTGYTWIFESPEKPPEKWSKVEGHTTLKAKWIDDDKPYDISIRRQSYKAFEYEAWDNLGITKWAVVKNSSEEPTEWNLIKPKTHLKDTYEIDSAGEYRFWISDANGNTAYADITAYAINIIIFEADGRIPPHKYSFTEGDKEFVTTFAFKGTTLSLNIKPDEHYKDIKVDISTPLDGLDNTFVVRQDTDITVGSKPKQYTVTFIPDEPSGDHDDVEIESQTITYLHKPTQPLALYHKGYIISNWYKDSKLQNCWDFETDVVEGDITLYAKWQEYITPTKVTIQIPEEANFTEWEDAPKEPIRAAYTTQEKYEAALAEYNEAKANFEENRFKVSVNYTQNRPNDVKVCFGDSSDKFSSEATIYATSISHTYTQPGKYVIEIYGTPHGYTLGGSYSSQAVDPAYYITNIEFAWDITTTRDYAFRGAQIEELKLTPYMTSIAPAAFAACKNLKTINIPSSISKIGAGAFKDCTGLVGTIVIPKTIFEVGNDLFTNCSNIDEIVFEESGILQEISSRFANNSGIKRLDVPAYIHHIKSDAFGNCNQLTKVILRHSELTLEEFVFNSTPKLISAGPIEWDVGAGNSLKYNIEYAWTEIIPAYAFSARTNFRQSYLDSITFHKDLKEIGYAAFRGASLEANNLKFPPPTNDKHFLKIGEEAFCNTDLVDLDLPAHIRSVGARAFGENRMLSTAILRFPTSEVKINAASNSWFLGCKPKDGSEPKLMPKIPRTLAADPIDLVGAYGDSWNFYDDNPDTDPETGKPRKLSYAGIES